jgi:hypothetical protein
MNKKGEDEVHRERDEEIKMKRWAKKKGRSKRDTNYNRSFKFILHLSHFN